MESISTFDYSVGLFRIGDIIANGVCYTYSLLMVTTKHLSSRLHFVVYFDGSTTTVYSSSKFYFFFVAASPHLYVDYTDELFAGYASDLL